MYTSWKEQEKGARAVFSLSLSLLVVFLLSPYLYAWECMLIRYITCRAVAILCELGVFHPGGSIHVTLLLHSSSSDYFFFHQACKICANVLQSCFLLHSSPSIVGLTIKLQPAPWTGVIQRNLGLYKNCCWWLIGSPFRVEKHIWSSKS